MGKRAWKMMKVAVPIAIVGVLTLALAGRSLAWTHLVNHYDNNPNDYTCGYNSSVPCLYWPEPNHVSSTQYASIDPTLSSLGPAHYNEASAVDNAFGYWNAVQGAFNPYLYDCTYTGCVDPIHYDSATLVDTFTYAITYNNWGPVQYANGQYYAMMTSTTTTFNNTVTFNSTLTYSAPGVTPVVADGRKVATHETGHVEGLGHTARTNAVMKQGNVQFYKPNTDDINAVQSIYTGYIPS